MNDINGFYSAVVSQELHDILTSECPFTKEELDILDYTTIPELRSSINIDCIKRANGTRIEHSREAIYLRKIVKKLHYIIYELTKLN